MVSQIKNLKPLKSLTSMVNFIIETIDFNSPGAIKGLERPKNCLIERPWIGLSEKDQYSYDNDAQGTTLEP